MAEVTVCSGFGAQEEEICHCFHHFPFWMGLDAKILVFLMLSFNLAFSLSSFTLIKKLFSSLSFSAIRVVSSVYLKLLMFLLAPLIPACASSSQAFHMMSSAHKLNKKVTIYSLDVLLFPFGPSPLFHVWF